MVVAPAGALADLLTGSRWRIDLDGVSADVLDRAVRRFLDADDGAGRADDEGRAAELRRPRCGGVADRSKPDGLDLVLAHTVPLVRPDDVLTALARSGPGLASEPAAAADPAASRARLLDGRPEIVEPL